MTTTTAIPLDAVRDHMPAVAAVALDRLRYYDFRRHWTKRIVPHLADKKLNAILVRDFNRYALSPFRLGDLPADFDSLDWRLDRRRPHPRYWDYVVAGACHWLVNVNIRLATLAEPDRPWRIITGARHSSVWDGNHTLFDLNYSAFGFSPRECYRQAYERELSPGRFRKGGYPDFSH
jgi:hypothetical protein